MSRKYQLQLAALLFFFGITSPIIAEENVSEAATPDAASEAPSSLAALGNASTDEAFDDEFDADESEAQKANALPADYSIKLKDLEQRVNQLKERIHQSKARLVQLQEVVINGAINGARAKIIHRNELGHQYIIERIQYSLDSQPIYNKVQNNGDLTKNKEFVVFEDNLTPGSHLLSVYIELRGDGKMFQYLNDYEFQIKSSNTFSADEGKLTTVVIVPYLKGNPTYSMEDRPTVRYDVERKKALRDEFEQSTALTSENKDSKSGGMSSAAKAEAANR